jgi:hypothetical protein
MKNLLIVFALLAVPFGVSAQQFIAKAATTSVDGESAVKMSNGDIVVVGESLGSGFISRYNSSGVLFMKKVDEQDLFFPPFSVYTTSHLWSVTSASNGDIIAVGFADDEDLNTSQEKGLVVRFGPMGNLLWSKTLSIADSTMRFYGVAEDAATGDIFATGTISPVSAVTERTEILVKLGQDGSFLWMKKLSHIVGTSQYGMKVLLKGDSVLVFGEHQIGAFSDITVSVYQKSDGLCLMHFPYNFGFNSNDEFCDAIIVLGKVYFAFQQTGSFPTLVRLDENLSVLGEPLGIYSIDGVSIYGCNLGSRGSSIFCSGRASNSSSFVGIGSYAVRLDLNLSSSTWFSVAWGKSIGASSISGMNTQFEVISGSGGISFVGRRNTSGNSEVVSMVLSSAGDPLGVYCDLPQNLGFQPQNFPTASVNIVVRNQTFLNPVLGTRSFVNLASDFTNCEETVLPVELVSFTGEQVGSTSLLSWQTATEQNVSHFSVQRSVDGEWKEIGTVSATGNSQHLLGYEFVDDTPFAGDNYYRLETIDTDGSTEFSDVVVVHFDGLGYELTVYPNPASAGEALNVKGEFFEAVAHDQLGREVKLQRNGNQLVVQAGRGVYLLTFTDANGATETVRVVTN